MTINLNLLHKIIFPLLTVFIAFLNYIITLPILESGFGSKSLESELWPLGAVLIILLIFFAYFTSKIFTEKGFEDTWKRTLKTTTIGSIVFAVINGLSALVIMLYLILFQIESPLAIDYSYVAIINILIFLSSPILIIIMGINFYRDFRIYERKKRSE
jgi:hypothetical protein